MNRAEAYKILGIDPSSDVRPVDGAYWELARTYSAQLNHDPHAAKLLNQLNEAYSVLARDRAARTVQNTKTLPHAKMRLVGEPARPETRRTKSSPRLETRPATTSPPPVADWLLVLEAIGRWIRAQAGLTAARWVGRRVEIGVLTVCLLVLAGLAYLGGPSHVATFMVLAVALLTIWSPWRRPG